jgi:UDP-hydrolysing UDP-N-acetyl-D-glucosamine 2-epimerase
MKAVKEDAAFELQTVVTGMHLSHEFGLTYKKILADGFEITDKIEMLLSSDSSVGITKSIGLGVIGFADCYARLQPDLVVLLGDRFETLAAAQAAFIAKIPIAHIHGGELTMGAYDDGIRHCITKLSHLHFVATEQYRQRVIQLGEQPQHVFHVGAMVLDSVQKMTFLKQSELEAVIGLKLDKPTFVITYHPETLSQNQPQDEFLPLLGALEKIQDTNLIFTKGNADTEGRIINDMIDQFCQKHQSAKAFHSLGHQNYLSLLSFATLVIGNSSSGVIEVPYFKIPTINMGDRQKGRIHPDSVINCEASIEGIQAALKTAMMPTFKEKIANMVLPYGSGDIAEQIIRGIKNANFNHLIQKQFFDIKSGAMNNE